MSKAQAKSKKPRTYKPTPTKGALFDVWLLDTANGKIWRTSVRGLTWDEALEFMREWMEADRRCIPVIVRKKYKIPSEIYVFP